MSNRANYVLVRDGKAEVFYDRHGALGCIFSFMRGPDGAADSARTLGDPGPLLFGGEIEGGYLIDFDREVALAFGEPDTSFVKSPRSRELGELARVDPHELMQRLADRWPGWKLRWVEETEDFEAYLKGRGLTGA